MKIRKALSFHYITLFVFCQVFAVGTVFAEGVAEEKLENIVAHCDEIRENLKKVQREDSVVRTHIGPYYNTVLEKFMKPLNLRLVENNLYNAGLMENQSSFAVATEVFRSDYSEYQRGLEELVLMDCSQEPEKFYSKLEAVREKRAAVSGDVSKMRVLVSEQMVVVKELRAGL